MEEIWILIFGSFFIDRFRTIPVLDLLRNLLCKTALNRRGFEPLFLNFLEDRTVVGGIFFIIVSAFLNSAGIRGIYYIYAI